MTGVQTCALPIFEAINEREAASQINGNNSKVTLGSGGTPFIQCRWVNPPENMALAPSYSFSLPRYVVYDKECTAAQDRKSVV